MLRQSRLMLIRRCSMSRPTVLVLAALVATGPAFAADQVAVQRKAVHAARQLPPGLPRAHYNYRTTIAPPTAVVVEQDPDALISPSFSTPILLPGSSTLPGHYGRPFDFTYQGAYYGGPYTPYFVRLPYACGVLGYC
jgi:hypothetical protein